MKNHFISKVRVVFILFSLIISGCAMPSLSKFTVDETDNEEIFKSTTDVTLLWADVNTITVESYKVYYKPHGDSTWILLDSIPSSSPNYEISHSQIGNGIWDFGVSAVDELGNESKIHSSLEVTANPNTGWYLLWAK